jgi:hypothetical protein
VGVERSIIDWLEADASITADIRPIARPQGDQSAAVCVQRISGGMTYADDGETGLTNCRIQIDTYASSYASAKTIAKTVLARMNSAVDQVVSGVTFRSVALDSEQDIWEGPLSYERRVSQDYIIISEG